MIRVLLITILVLSQFGLWAQHPYFYQLNHENGLPSNEVYCVKQDRDAFIWIGCDAGLVKYDGFAFQLISQPDKQSNSLSNIFLHEGKDVWCQNFKGQIFVMNNEEEELKLAFDASAYSSNFPEFTIDKKGRAWVMTEEILFRVDKFGKAEEMTNVSALKMPSGKFASIGTTSDGAIAVVDYTGKMMVLNGEGKVLRSTFFPYQPGFRYHFYGSVESLVLVSEEKTATGFSYLLNVITAKDDSKVKHWKTSIPSKILNYTVNGNEHLCSTDQGVYIANEKGVIHHLFPGQKVSSVLKDKEGLVWASSLQEGIFIIPSVAIRVIGEGNPLIKDYNFSALTVKDASTITVGNYSGELYDLNIHTGNMSPVFSSQGNLRAARKILYRGEQTYIARGDFQIYTKGKAVQTIPELSNTRDFSLKGDTIFYTASDRTGYIFPQNGKWVHRLLRKKGGKNIAVSASHVLILFTDGLYRWQNGNMQKIHYKGKPLFVNELHADKEKVYLATVEDGVLVYKDQGLKVKYGPLKERTNKEVLSFFSFNDHDLILTREGVTLIDKRSGKRDFINEFDGLAIKEITAAVLCGSKVCLATINGLFEVPLSSSSKNTVAPSLKVAAIYINGIKQGELPRIELTPQDYELTFSIASIALRSRGNYSLRYRMKGLTDKWTQIHASQRQITYTSLPPGSYVFEVMAINEDGVASKSIRKEIYVSSALYQKWWFNLILLLLILSIMFLIFRWQLKKIRQRAKMKQDMVAAQLTALKAQMNPHFLFNTMNSIQDLILQQDFKSTNYYLSKFSTLMRMILTNSEKSEVEISEEITMLGLYLQLEKLRFGDEFSYTIECEESLQSSGCKVPPMIIQPFIENAIKHGLLHKRGEKVLSIVFKEEQDTVLCEIVDNGIGREASMKINQRQRQQHVSFSTQATDERLGLLEDFYGRPYQLEIIDLKENDEAIGTKVIIQFPRV